MMSRKYINPCIPWRGLQNRYVEFMCKNTQKERNDKTKGMFTETEPFGITPIAPSLCIGHSGFSRRAFHCVFHHRGFPDGCFTVFSIIGVFPTDHFICFLRSGWPRWAHPPVFCIRGHPDTCLTLVLTFGVAPSACILFTEKKREYFLRPNGSFYGANRYICFCFAKRDQGK